MKIIKVFFMGITLTACLATLGCGDFEDFLDLPQYNEATNGSNGDQNSSEKLDPKRKKEVPINKLPPSKPLLNQLPLTEFLVNFYQKEADIGSKLPLPKLAKVVLPKSKLTLPTNPSPPTNEKAGFVFESHEHAGYYAYFQGWYYRDGSDEKKWDFKNDVVEKKNEPLRKME